jgi:bla regulator protein BlaR1
MFTINYLFEVTICWLICYGFYYAFLRRETFFKTNRIYLIISLLIGLVIPKLQLTIEQPDVVFVQTVQLSVQTISAQVETTAMTLPSVQDVFWGVYFFGIIILTIRLMMDMFKIWTLKKNGIVIQYPDYQLVISDELHPPFSFFYYLFIANEHFEKQEDSEKIIAHELAHIRGKHSLDVLLSEILGVLFWFNPLVYWYKKSLQDVHEFLADSEVTRNTSIKKYGHLLLRQAVPSAYIALSNHFNHSQLKKRISMMTKKKSSKWAFSKYALALPMIALMAILFSAYDYPTVLDEKAEQILNISRREATVSTTDSIYDEVDEMPRYPGCEDLTDAEQKELCSQKKLLMFIYENVKYPKAAQKNGTEGTAVIEFVVKKNGQLADFKIVRGLADGCDAAALEAVQKMVDTKWIAGKKDGKAVNVKMKMPIKFKLSGEAKTEKAGDVDEMPRFPNCDEGTAEEKTKCSNGKLLQFIIENLEYPEEAKKAKTEGMVVVSFVVGKDGKIIAAKVVKSLSVSCDEAALAVIHKMQEQITWTSGMKDGKAVAVEMNLPFKFALE